MTTYQMIIHSDDGGGLLASGHVGHFYVELQAVNGTNVSSMFFGKYPVSDLDALNGPGLIQNDAARFQTDQTDPNSNSVESNAIPLTVNQYANVLSYINNQTVNPDNYAFFGDNCADFMQQVYTSAGFGGNFLDAFNPGQINWSEEGPAGLYAELKYGDGIITNIADTFSAFGSSITQTLGNGVTDVTQFFSNVFGEGKVQDQTTYFFSDNQLFSGQQIGSTIGSDLGKFLGGDNVFAQIGASTLGSLLIGKVFQSAGSLGDSLIDNNGQGLNALTSAFDNLDAQSVGGALGAQTENALSGLLVSEAAQALGLSGFAGQVFTNALPGALSVGAQVISNIENGVSDLFQGIQYANLLTAFAGNLAAAEGSKVANDIVSPSSEGEALFGSIGGDIGSLAGTILPVIGSFVGDVLGTLAGDVVFTLINDLTGGWLENYFDPGQYVSLGDTYVPSEGQFVSQDEGTKHSKGDPRAAVAELNGAYLQAINAILRTVGGTLDTSTFNSILNAQASFIYETTGNGYPNGFTVVLAGTGGGPLSGSDSNLLVRAAIENEIQQMRFLSGDALQIRAITDWQNLQVNVRNGDALDTLTSYMQVATDYRTYLENAPEINALMAATPDTAFTEGWLATLLQAESLGLNTVSTAVSGVNAANAQGVATNSSVTTIAVSDTVANVQANLAALETLVANGKLTSISFTDAAPSLTLSMAQLASELTLLAKINGSYTLIVSDSSTNVLANMPMLQTLAAGGHLSGIVFTDTGSPVLPLTAAQLTADAQVLSLITSPFSVSLAVSNSTLTLGSNLQASIVGNNDKIMGASGSSGGDTVTVSGTGEQVGLWNSTLNVAANAAVSLISDAQASQDSSGDTINMLAGSHLTLSGNAGATSNVINAVSGDYINLTGPVETVLLNGNGLTVTATGLDDWLTLQGTGAYIAFSGSEGSVTISGLNDSIGLSGNDDVAALNATSEGITISGNNDSVTAKGSADTINLKGTSDSATLTGAGQVNLSGASDSATLAAGNEAAALTGSKDTVTVNGNSDSITVSGVTDFATLNGTKDNAIISGSNTVDAYGTSDTLTLNAGSTSIVHLYGNSETATDGGSTDRVIAIGNGDTIIINSTGDDDAAAGANDIVKLTSTGSFVSVSGTADTITVTGTTNDVFSYGSSDVYNIIGDSNSVSDSTSSVNSVFNLSGNSDGIDVYGTGGSVTLSGNGDRAFLYAGNSTINVTGANATVYSFVANTTLRPISGASAYVTLYADYDSVTVSGTSQTIYAINNYDTVISSGTQATIWLDGTAGTATASGVSSMVYASGNNSIVTLNGATESAMLFNNNDTVTANGNGDSVIVDGSYDTVTLNGANETATDNAGSNNTITLQGTGEAVSISIAGITVNSSGNSITLNAGAGGTIVNGTGNTYFLGAGVQFALNGESGNSVNLSSNDQVTLSSNSLNNSFSASGMNDSVTWNLGSGSQVELFSPVASIATEIQNWTGANASGNDTQNIIDWAAGGSEVDNFTYTSSTMTDVANGYTTSNGGTGTPVYTQTTVTNLSTGLINATISGMGDTTFLSNAVINLTGNNITANIIGNDNDILALSTAKGDSITLSETGDSATLSNANITFAAGTSASVTGASDTILGASGSSGNMLTISGTGEKIGLWNSVINVAAGSSLSLISDAPAGMDSSGDTINLSGSDTVTLGGNAGPTSNSFVSAGTNNSFTLNGAAETATFSGSAISISVTAAGDNLILNSNGDYATLSASATNSSVTANNSGDSAGLSGNGQKAFLNAVSEGATLSGTNDTVTAISSAATIILKGSSNNAILSGAGAVTISGTSDAAALNAGYEAVTISGNSNTATITGNSDTATVSGTGNTLTINGSKETIALGSSNTLIVNGTTGNVITLGSNDQVTLGVNSTIANNTFHITGTNDSVTTNFATGSQVELFNPSASISTEIENWTQQNGTGSMTSATITGTAGNDTLTANAANETLVGNGGSDIYQFGRGDGPDVIQNGLAANSGHSGELDFGTGIATNQIWLVQNGNNLQLDIMGTHDQMTVANWFGSSTAGLQEIKASGSMLDVQLNQLVQAMATYSSAHAGFDPTAVTQAPADTTLQSAIAAAWHH